MSHVPGHDNKKITKADYDARVDSTDLPKVPTDGAIKVGTTEIWNGEVHQWDGNRWFRTGVMAGGTPKESTRLGDTINVGGRVMQWNPNTGTYDKDLGSSSGPAAAPAPRYPEGGVTTTGQTYKIDPYTGDITLGPIYGTLATTRTPQQLRQDVLDDIKAQREYTDRQAAESQRFATSERGAGQTFTTGERLGRQEFDSGEGQLGRQFTSGENTLNRQFQGAESMLGRQFTSGESAIDRAQRAGEFAANYSITKAQAQRQDREAALNAAKTYTELTASPDLTGFQRFLSAGGGSVGNALQRGATSMTREGQLGGARALQVSEQPLPTYMDYNFTPQTNPYAGATNQYMNATNQYANAVNPVLAIQRAAVPAATIPAATVTPRAVVAPSIDGGSWNPGTSGQSYLDRPNVPDFVKPGYVAPPMPSPASTPAPFVTQAAVPSEGLQWDAGSGFAYGTGQQPILRYAYGTQDMPRYGFGTQTNRLLGRPDRLPPEPNDPFRTIPDTLRLSDQGRASLEGTRGKWDFEDVRGFYNPLNSRLTTATNPRSTATNAHEFTHSAQSRNAIDLGRFIGVLQRPKVIKDVAAAANQRGFNYGEGGVGYGDNLKALISDVETGKLRTTGSILERAMLGTYRSDYDPLHLYTAVSEAYGGRAYDMPAELRGFFPHLQQTESADDPNAEAPRAGWMQQLNAGARNKVRDFIDRKGLYPAGRYGLPPTSIDPYMVEMSYDPRYFPLNDMMEARRYPYTAHYDFERAELAAPSLSGLTDIEGTRNLDRRRRDYEWLAEASAAAKDAAEQEAPSRSDFYAYGTQGMPRYALGTQDMPVGMDTQFMSGDSTSLDPMSGGARPETVSINDPTGDATFSVDPLQPPDGPSEGGRAAELSSLLKALSQFLDKGEEPAPMPVAPRYAFGTYMMPGYAYGTGIMESDNPYIDRVMAQRQATPYTMNTQAADYSFGSPTLRSINEMGAQVATGVPMVEFGYEANRLRPGMLSRDSLNLGQ